jgi:hypothetical protein
MITQEQYDQAVQSPLKLSKKKRKSVLREPLWVSYVAAEFLNDPRFRTLLHRPQEPAVPRRPEDLHDDPHRLASRRRAGHRRQPHVRPREPAAGAGERRPADGRHPRDAGRQLEVAGAQVQPRDRPGGGRSAGSAFKAFTLATALMQGISPDATYNGSSPKTIPDCGGTGATWTVNNAEPGGGTYTLRSATWAS